MENKIYLGDASSSSMMDKYGVKVSNVGDVDYWMPIPAIPKEGL